jgi:uncharacterized membrane protein
MRSLFAFLLAVLSIILTVMAIWGWYKDASHPLAKHNTLLGMSGTACLLVAFLLTS